MKKRFKLWVAYMLILCMSMAVMLPNSKTVRADDTGELNIFNFNVLKDRDPIDKDTELWDDDPLRVVLEWSLPDSDHTHKVFSTVIEDYSNIKFVDKQKIELTYKEEVVGELTVDIDEDSGKVTVSAVFEDEFLQRSDRRGGAIVAAYADVHKSAEDNGKEENISIRTYNFPFTYRTNGYRSSLWVWKSAQGKLYKDENGNNKQDFYVSLQANGGDVTDVKLFDEPGSGLSIPDKIKIEKSNMPEIEEGIEMTLQELEAKLTLMPDDAQIGFTYTASVDANVYSESAAQNGDYKNTFKAEYKDNESEPKKAESSADVNVSRPYVGKDGEILKDADGNPTGKIKWTVKISLNGLAGESITDITDAYLAGASNKVLKPIEKNGKVSGYELTYETDIPAADMNSLSDHRYINDVTVSIDGHNYTGRGEAVLPAKSWISKTFENYDSEKNILSWKIVCEVPNESITGVSLADWGEWSSGYHEVIKESVRLEVDGNIIDVPEADWSGNQPVYMNGTTIEFSDDYFGNLKGKTLTVYVDTQIKDDSVDGNTYINKAQLQYSLNGTVTTLEASAEWKYDSAIIKTGAPDSSATAIDYSVDIDLSKIELNAGIPIIITDILPEGLTLDKDSCEVIGKAVYNEWGGEWSDEELTKASTVKVNVNGRVIRFEIPVTDTMVNRIKAIKDNDTGAQKVALALKYTAGISDVRKYLADGAELTFTNTATAEYGGKDIGRGTNVTRLTPKQMIKKDMWYDDTTAPNMRYKIEVNPDRLDLSDGSLTVTDSMGEKLIFCLDTIQVQKDEGNNNLVTLVKGKDYTYVYSKKDNSVVFTLPDSESLIISYEAYVNAYTDINIVNNEELNEQNSFNSVNISGYRNGNGSSKVSFDDKAITSSGWAESTTNYARLLKIYKSKNGTVMLEGCKFRLVEYSLNGGKLVEGRTIKTVVTDENGFARLDGMTGGQLYGLVETGVPAGGFTVKKQPLYFIFGNRAQNPFPSEYEVLYVNDGAPIIFENDPPDKEESSEESSESSEATKPSVTEEETTKKGDVEGEGNTTAKDPSQPETETSTKKGDVEGEGNTTPNDPSQPENETKAPQTVTEPEGETDPDNDRNGELEGEGNLVNTSDRPYIKVILILMILSVVAAAITEITMLCSGTED